MTNVFVGLGSNLGDRHHNLTQAVEHLSRIPHTSVCKVSTFIETEPLYLLDQPPFLNGAAKLLSSLGPVEILKHLKDIERKVGRKPRERYGPRELDLDLILYGICHYRFGERLQIPHPLTYERTFVLQPLYEIESSLEIPGMGPVRDLLRNLQLPKGSLQVP